MPIELILRANIHSFTPSLPPHQPIYSLISCSAYPSYHPLKKQERARKREREKAKASKSTFWMQNGKIFIICASIDEAQFNDFQHRKLKNLWFVCTVLVPTKWVCVFVSVSMNGMITRCALHLCICFIHFYWIRGRDREMILADAVIEQFRLE